MKTTTENNLSLVELFDKQVEFQKLIVAEENLPVDNIDWFKTQVNCSIIDSETLENLNIFNKKGYILLPYTYQSDGFYMVGLKKNNR